MKHEIILVGPISYPGGKDGSYQAECSCGEYRSSFGTESSVKRSHEQHATAKENQAE